MKMLNKKRLKDKELETILKQFDEFQFPEGEKKENIKNRLQVYIPYVNKVIQQYENTKHKYLSLNISFFAVMSFFLSFVLGYLNINFAQGVLIISGSLICGLFSLLNLLYFQFRDKTHTLHDTTLWFYKGNVSDERRLKISKLDVTNFLAKFHREEEKFIIEDLKQLFTLYLYQIHYKNMASKSRRNSLIIISLFLFYMLILFIIP